MEEERAKIVEKTAVAHTHISEAEEQLKEVEKELKSSTKVLLSAEKEQEVVERARTDAIKMLKNIELDLKELQGQTESENFTKAIFEGLFSISNTN